jgi:hypothetical protein
MYEQAKEKNEYNGLLLGSIRCAVDAEAIARNAGVLIFVDAPIEKRYRRSLLRKRNQEESRASFASFKNQDKQEFYGVNDDPYQPNQRAIKSLANYVINNDASIDEFKSELNVVVEKIESTI